MIADWIKTTDDAPPLTAATLDRAMKSMLKRPHEPALMPCGSDQAYDTAIARGYNAVRVFTERDL